MSAPAPALEVDSLHRFYPAGDEEVQALRAVSLVAQRGELIAVTGPSGSGKSTLLSCIAGLDEPDGGTVRIEGERMTRRSEVERARIRASSIGVLTQGGDLVGHLSLAGNVDLVRALVPGHRRSADELLGQLGLGQLTGALPATLSGGESARAGLAVALANAPVLLLADEPTGELDGATEREVLTLLRATADRGSAVVVASHSPAVTDAADRIITLRDGQVER